MKNKLEWLTDDSGSRIAQITDASTNMKFRIYKFWNNKNEKTKSWKLADFSITLEYPNGEFLSLYKLELRKGDDGTYIYDVSQLPKFNRDGSKAMKDGKQATMPTRTMSQYFRETIAQLAEFQYKNDQGEVVESIEVHEAQQEVVRQEQKEKESTELRELFNELDFFEDDKDKVEKVEEKVEESKLVDALKEVDK